MPRKENAQILDHQQIATNFFKLTLVSNYISKNCSPGQFINVRISKETTPLLRRPFSIHNFDRSREIIEILYAVVGQGTELLSKKEIKDKLDIIGPLGKGFTSDKNKKFSILVVGGMGIAPILALAKELKKTKEAVYVLIGARNKECLICEPVFKALECQTLCITNDGSSGKKGLVTDLLPSILESNLADDNSEIFTCGPQAMLKLVAEYAISKKIPCQVSLEEYMGCGIGTCNGCIVKTKTGYQKVCKDGPVFNAGDIVW